MPTLCAMMNRLLFTLYTWRIAAFVALQARAAAIVNVVTSATSAPRSRLADATLRFATIAQRTGASIHKAAWKISPIYPCDLCGTHFGTSGLGDMQFCERHAELYANKLPIPWLDAVEISEDCHLITRAQSNNILAALCFIADSGDPAWEKIGGDYLTKSGALFKGVKRLAADSRKGERLRAAKNFTDDVAKIHKAEVVADKIPLDEELSVDNLTDGQVKRLLKDIDGDVTLHNLGEVVNTDVASGLTRHAMTGGEVEVLRYLSAQKTSSGDTLYVNWDALTHVAPLSKMTPVALHEALMSLTAKNLVIKQGKPAIMGEAWRSVVDVAVDFGGALPEAPIKATVAERKAKAGFRVIDGGGEPAPLAAPKVAPAKSTMLVTTGDDGNGDGCA